jgi:hypothetical protein
VKKFIEEKVKREEQVLNDRSEIEWKQLVSDKINKKE